MIARGDHGNYGRWIQGCRGAVENGSGLSWRLGEAKGLVSVHTQIGNTCRKGNTLKNDKHQTVYPVAISKGTSAMLRYISIKNVIQNLKGKKE